MPTFVNEKQTEMRKFFARELKVQLMALCADGGDAECPCL